MAVNLDRSKCQFGTSKQIDAAKLTHLLGKNNLARCLQVDGADETSLVVDYLMTIKPTQETGQHTATENAQVSRSQVTVLMQKLQAALAAASFERSHDWNIRVQSRLIELQLALSESREEINARDGLFAEIISEHPRLSRRINNLKSEYLDLERQIEVLCNQFKSSEEPVDVADVRERLGWLLKAMRHVQSKETEVIFEAIGTDIGVGD